GGKKEETMRKLGLLYPGVAGSASELLFDSGVSWEAASHQHSAGVEARTARVRRSRRRRKATGAAMPSTTETTGPTPLPRRLTPASRPASAAKPKRARAVSSTWSRRLSRPSQRGAGGQRSQRRARWTPASSQRRTPPDQATPTAMAVNRAERRKQAA